MRSRDFVIATFDTADNDGIVTAYVEAGRHDIPEEATDAEATALAVPATAEDATMYVQLYGIDTLPGQTRRAVKNARDGITPLESPRDDD